METFVDIWKYKRITVQSFIILIFLLSFNSFSQPKQAEIQVIVAPENEDWNYKFGENINFQVEVLKYGNPLQNIKAEYIILPEKMDPIKKGFIDLINGKALIDAGSFQEACFMRCSVIVNIKGKDYIGYATAGIEPDKIEPTTDVPEDFDLFWNNNLNELKEIPVDPVITFLPKESNDKINVYHVKVRNIMGSIYGILCVPKEPGTYSALLEVPGAGVRPYQGYKKLAEQGIITFQIGIHGVPVNMDQYIYDNLWEGPINYYWDINLDDKDKYYYKRVYIGCVRAVDFIFELPEFDKSIIAVYGGSQGGALSITTAALDKRIKYLGVFYPALCDLTGFLHNRAGGWPFLFTYDFSNKPDKIEVSKYYDVVNFAKRLKIPGLYSWGYNDDVCPPTSMYSAYNVINAPKELIIAPNSQHWRYPEQQEKMEKWLIDKLVNSSLK